MEAGRIEADRAEQHGIVTQTMEAEHIAAERFEIDFIAGQKEKQRHREHTLIFVAEEAEQERRRQKKEQHRQGEPDRIAATAKKVEAESIATKGTKEE